VHTCLSTANPRCFITNTSRNPVFRFFLGTARVNWLACRSLFQRSSLQTRCCRVYVQSCAKRTSSLSHPVPDQSLDDHKTPPWLFESPPLILHAPYHGSSILPSISGSCETLTKKRSSTLSLFFFAPSIVNDFHLTPLANHAYDDTSKINSRFYGYLCRDSPDLLLYITVTTRPLRPLTPRPVASANHHHVGCNN
jgi:hypothetical protein